jgi:hypothetical protein
VFGCRLRDGREVAVKVHRPGIDLIHGAFGILGDCLYDQGDRCAYPQGGAACRRRAVSC